MCYNTAPQCMHPPPLPLFPRQEAATPPFYSVLWCMPFQVCPHKYLKPMGAWHSMLSHVSVNLEGNGRMDRHQRKTGCIMYVFWHLTQHVNDFLLLLSMCAWLPSNYTIATIPQSAFVFTAEFDRWLFFTLQACSNSKADNDCYSYNIIGLFFWWLLWASQGSTYESTEAWMLQAGLPCRSRNQTE